MDEETRRALSRIEGKLGPVERIESTLSRIESSHTEGRQEIDELGRGVTRLVRIIKDDGDDREERDEDALDRLKEIRTFVDETLPHLLKELPEKVLAAVELKIYELRIERFKAREAGILNDPTPLLPSAPLQRDPTGRFPALPPADRDTGRVPRVELEPARDTDGATLTPAQQRGLWRFIVKHWPWAKYPTGIVTWEGLRKLYDAIRHAVGH